MQFSNNVKEPFSHGRMVDVSSNGAAFLCPASKNCPQLGKLVTTCISVPRFDSEKTFDAASFNRFGRVYRIDKINTSIRRVAIQFTKSLSLKPGEQPISTYDRIYKLATNSDGPTAALSLQFKTEHNDKTT